MTRLASDAEPLRYYGPLIGFEMSPGKRGDYVRYSDYAALLTRLDAQESALREAVEIVRPFANEADNWADSVPDSHRSLCTEPGKSTAHPGSETTFTVGALRAARAWLAKQEPEPSQTSKIAPPPRAEEDGDAALALLKAKEGQDAP